MKSLFFPKKFAAALAAAALASGCGGDTTTSPTPPPPAQLALSCPSSFGVVSPSNVGVAVVGPLMTTDGPAVCSHWNVSGPGPESGSLDPEPLSETTIHTLTV